MAGFEPNSSVPQVDTMTTAPRHFYNWCSVFDSLQIPMYNTYIGMFHTELHWLDLLPLKIFFDLNFL
jgi:hypothetical protein